MFKLLKSYHLFVFIFLCVQSRQKLPNVSGRHLKYSRTLADRILWEGLDRGSIIRLYSSSIGSFHWDGAKNYMAISFSLDISPYFQGWLATIQLSQRSPFRRERSTAAVWHSKRRAWSRSRSCSWRIRAVFSALDLANSVHSQSEIELIVFLSNTSDTTQAIYCLVWVRNVVRQ